MISPLTKQVRQRYREQVADFLNDAPGGLYYDRDAFDLEAYKKRICALRAPHEYAHVSLAGIPSVWEKSWLWTDRELITHLLSPINVTQLRVAAEQYERAIRCSELEAFELGQRVRLNDDVIEPADLRVARKGDRVTIRGFDALTKPLNVSLIESIRSFWVGTGLVTP